MSEKRLATFAVSAVGFVAAEESNLARSLTHLSSTPSRMLFVSTVRGWGIWQT
jgi:hypothetical protein